MNNINAVIFDLGGVLINLDLEKTFNCFKKNFNINSDDINKAMPFFEAAEKGLLTAKQLVQKLQQLFNKHIDFQQFINCWNALILDLPLIRLKIVEKFKEKYPVFLLSNISDVHHQYVESKNYIDYNLFDKVFLSYKLGTRKPEPEIFNYVLQQIKFKPEQILFFDDNIANINTANELGFNTIHVNKPLEILIKEKFPQFYPQN